MEITELKKAVHRLIRSVNNLERLMDKVELGLAPPATGPQDQFAELFDVIDRAFGRWPWRVDDLVDVLPNVLVKELDCWDRKTTSVNRRRLGIRLKRMVDMPDSRGRCITLDRNAHGEPRKHRTNANIYVLVRVDPDAPAR